MYAPHLAVGDTLQVPDGASYQHLWFPTSQRTWATVTIGDNAVLGVRDSFHATTLTLGASATFGCTSVSTSPEMALSLDQAPLFGAGSAITCVEQPLRLIVAAPLALEHVAVTVATETSTTDLAVGVSVQAPSVALTAGASLSGAASVNVATESCVSACGCSTVLLRPGRA